MVKHACHADKAGHTGTRDPLATGLLTICLGESTKYSQDLFNADKSYVANILFGAKTDTGDSEGKVIARCEEPTEEFKNNFAQYLQQIIPRFCGERKLCGSHSCLQGISSPLFRNNKLCLPS